MFLYVRRSFMIFKIVLACIAFMAGIIALMGTSQNSFLLTQESGKQLGALMALVLALITIVEAFMAPPEAIVSGSGWKTTSESPLMEVGKIG
jgi:peptidoglycan biosynthesis protein MviN/MurJ (putative lipid II flippase)